MSFSEAMKAPAKIRTSARQAAARTRIGQIDHPAGSAPPFEGPPMAPKWVWNPSRAQERTYIEAMVQYLQEDPLVYNDILILRFVYKEWPLLQHSITTKITMDIVRKKLIAMQVRYIQCNENQEWVYWNDYTEEGVLAFCPPPDTKERQLMEDVIVSETPDEEKIQPHIMLPEQQNPLDENINDASSEDTTTTAQAPLVMEEDPYQKTSTKKDRDTHTSHWMQQLQKQISQDNRYFDTPESSAVSMADSPLLTPRPSPSVDSTRLNTSQVLHDVIDLSSPEDMQADKKQQERMDDDGFIKVGSRHISQRKSIQTKLPWSRSKLTPKELNLQPHILTETRPQVFKPAQPPTKQIQIDTFTEILQDRIVEALSRIDTREAMSLQRIRTEMVTLQQFETTWQETQKRAEDIQQQQKVVMAEREKKLQHDEHQLSQTRLAIQEAERQVQERFTEGQHQMEPALQSWMEVATTKFKDDLEGCRLEYQDQTQDFCTDHMQQLEAYLDGYHTSARVVQAELLVRLRNDVARAYEEARQQQEEHLSVKATPPRMMRYCRIWNRRR